MFLEKEDIWSLIYRLLSARLKPKGHDKLFFVHFDGLSLATATVLLLRGAQN